MLDTNIKVPHEIKMLVKNLNLFIVKGIIRTQGRFDNTDLPVNAQTSIFLPAQSKLVKLISLHIHQVNYHCEVAQTLSLVRQQIWSPKLRYRLKSLLSSCVTCKQLREKVLTRPLPTPLPAERAKWMQPFHTTGVDHTGYYWYRDKSRVKKKLYVCVFVCTVTGAVHLEVARDLSTPTFLLCLRKLLERARLQYFFWTVTRHL